MVIIKNKEQRVGIFIDTQNLYHSAKNLYQSKVNFSQVVKDALGDRILVSVLAYVITTETGEEKNFFEALEKTGIETKAKPLQIFAGGAKKGDWDVAIAVDAIKMAPKLDTIVLVSGDGDFIPLLDFLRNHFGCRTEVIAFGRSASGKLIENADSFIDLDKNTRKYLLSQKRPSRNLRTKNQR